MMHPVNEIYRIAKPNTKVAYSYNYYFKENAPEGARPLCWYTQKTLKVNAPDGSVKTIYMYGEKHWSFSLEEVEAYRAEQNVIREEQRKRNKLLKAIMAQYEEMSTEELEKIVEKIK